MGFRFAVVVLGFIDIQPGYSSLILPRISPAKAGVDLKGPAFAECRYSLKAEPLQYRRVDLVHVIFLPDDPKRCLAHPGRIKSGTVYISRRSYEAPPKPVNVYRHCLMMACFREAASQFSILYLRAFVPSPKSGCRSGRPAAPCVRPSARRVGVFCAFSSGGGTGWILME